MFRRVANVCVARSRLPVTTTTTTLTAPLCLCQTRWATTDAAASTTSAATTTNNSRTRSNAAFDRQRRRRAALPPAFDIVHWNDADVSRGHLLRVLHRNGYIVLDYHRQRQPSAAAADDDDTTSRRENRAEKVVTVTLPPVYIARFLGVLEGRMEKVDVQSRFTNAMFAPNTSKGPHHYTLHCTSMKPTTGQSQTIDGADVHEETVEWTVEMDPAESLMLHRFLSQALHQNSGFGRNA